MNRQQREKLVDLLFCFRSDQQAHADYQATMVLRGTPQGNRHSDACARLIDCQNELDEAAVAFVNEES